MESEKKGREGGGEKGGASIEETGWREVLCAPIDC